MDPSYRDITNEVVKDGIVNFANGFANGEKYLVKLENDFTPANGVNSTLLGGMKDKMAVSHTGVIAPFEPGGFVELVLSIKEVPNNSPIIAEKPELHIGIVPGDAPVHEKTELHIGIVPGEAPVHEKPELNIELPKPPTDETPKDPGVPTNETPEDPGKTTPPTPTKSVPQKETGVRRLPKTGTDNSSVLEMGLSIIALSLGIAGKRYRKEK